MSQTTVSSRWPKIGLPPRPFKTWLEFYKYVLPPPGPGHTGVHRYYYAYLDDYNLWESTTTEGAPPDVRTYDFNLDEEHADFKVQKHPVLYGVLGAVGALALIVAILVSVYCWRRFKRRRSERSGEERHAHLTEARHIQQDDESPRYEACLLRKEPDHANTYTTIAKTDDLNKTMSLTAELQIDAYDTHQQLRTVRETDHVTSAATEPVYENQDGSDEYIGCDAVYYVNDIGGGRVATPETDYDIVTPLKIH
ncbi:hypothetical protein CAPTEDRAFT_202974 [Capitella teleta]|uniref:Uncharacterized protein n=1 Tax=Capitella teleta TaxID=283909 RepID=R7TMJ1_CAPTE|nr:hypothetical protein CAPTEDRAFT_202974 [Capitella teleta]|eukprot:ELT95088.1 hypothetical protein CAPTEDRAFT_202974 [Capitella teleta]